MIPQSNTNYIHSNSISALAQDEVSPAIVIRHAVRRSNWTFRKVVVVKVVIAFRIKNNNCQVQ